MAGTKEEKASKPMKPLNIYFLFSAKRRLEQPGIKVKKLSAEYKALSDGEKEKLTKELKEAKIKYEKDLEKWENSHGDKEDKARRSINKKDESDAETKPEKTKGDKKGEKSKKEEKSEEKSKSKKKVK